MHVERFHRVTDYLGGRRRANSFPESWLAVFACMPGPVEERQVSLEDCHTAARQVVGNRDYSEAGNQDYSEDSPLVRPEEDSRPNWTKCQQSSRIQNI